MDKPKWTERAIAPPPPPEPTRECKWEVTSDIRIYIDEPWNINHVWGSIRLDDMPDDMEACKAEVPARLLEILREGVAVLEAMLGDGKGDTD